MERSFGLMFSQRVLLALADKGLAAPAGLRAGPAQRHARVAGAHAPSATFSPRDPEVMAHLTAAELDACFDPSWHLRNVDAIFQRLGLA